MKIPFAAAVPFGHYMNLKPGPRLSPARPGRNPAAARTFLAAVLLTLAAVPSTRSATLEYNGTNYFLNGINLAWHQFGSDFGQGKYDSTFFETMFSDLENYHVRELRYWVHCGGSGAMNYDSSGAVTGVSSTYFNDFDDFLSRAANHHVMVMLTLWSFDMCNNSQGPHTVLITDSTKTTSYINNVLIPIVTRYANNPNVIAYEVMNEPEGTTSSYGWTDNRVSTSQVQRFVAMIAAAIHQHCNKMVTTGSASLKYNSDVSPSVGNFWKNSALQAAYNSSSAYLDFYQIHFYDWMISGGWNPFDLSKPVSHWNLDKPCLVGEFYGQTDTNLNLTLDQLLANDYANGYIGHMPWTYNSRWAGSKGPLKSFGDAHASVVDGTPVGVPPAPTNLSASGGNGLVSLSWSAVSGAASYNVYRSTTSGGPYTLVASGVTATSYTDTGLASGTTYYYVVTAVNGSGESPTSNQASALTYPAPPTNLVATAGNGQVSLTWTASTGAASYNVYRSTTSGGPYNRIASGVATTSYTDTGLANGTTYYYVVVAVNSSGTSGNSNEASATPSAGTGTARPISINFVGNGTAMGASESAGVVAESNWNNASGPTGNNQALNDASGAGSGATLTWSADHNSSEGITDTAGNNRMMNGYVNTSSSSSTTVQVANLPASANGWTVYVYCEENTSGTTRVAAYQISGTGITTTTINATDPNTFNGTFTQANNSTGNYVVFTIGNVAGFTITATPVSSTDSNKRAPVNGLQIIPVATPPGGKPISVNFGASSATPMAASETAGVVAASNWNNALGLSGNNLALNDSTGAASGASLTWNDPKSANSTSITDTAGNNRMMKYYLDSSSSTTTTATVSSLPSNSNGYKVYVYFDGNNTETREGAYTISGTGITTTTINGFDNANTDFSGTFIQANNSAGNYVVFTIGNVSGFTVSATAVNNGAQFPRGPLNGMQIVPQ